MAVVLLVDDDALVLRTGASILKASGLDVVPVEAGEIALGVLDERGDSVDLVVLDLTMPGIGGVGAFKGIRERLPELPVLLVSGAPLEEGLADWEAGPTEFMMKPYRGKDLVARVREMLPVAT